MPGFRDTLRSRAVSVLIAAATDAGAHVISNRIDPTKAERLPLISVSCSRERKANQGLAIETPSFRAVVTVEVAAYVAGATMGDAEAAAERLIDQAQEALLNSATFLASPVLCVEGVEIDVEYSDRGEQYVGAAEMRFEIAYLDEYELAG